MNAFKLSLLALAVIAAVNLFPQETVKSVVYVDLRDGEEIPVKGTLFVPSILKWGSPLKNPKTEGIVVIRIDGVRFVYERTIDIPRNEYILRSRALTEVQVSKGDDIEVDFSDSNLEKEEEITVMIMTGGESV